MTIITMNMNMNTTMTTTTTTIMNMNANTSMTIITMSMSIIMSIMSMTTNIIMSTGITITPMISFPAGAWKPRPPLLRNKSAPRFVRWKTKKNTAIFCAPRAM